mmetsp:Transcript_75388/g.135829  ORF Transcript_75388/g.135829 Transcript_75388/m.135829 type:complete len:138 (+) Transcript_75388:118-531(+)
MHSAAGALRKRLIMTDRRRSERSCLLSDQSSGKEGRGRRIGQELRANRQVARPLDPYLRGKPVISAMTNVTFSARTGGVWTAIVLRIPAGLPCHLQKAQMVPLSQDGFSLERSESYLPRGHRTRGIDQQIVSRQTVK